VYSNGYVKYVYTIEPHCISVHPTIITKLLSTRT